MMPVLPTKEDGSICNLASAALLMVFGVDPFFGLEAFDMSSARTGASYFMMSSLWVSMAAI